MNQKINPLQAYKETSIKTASGGKLVVMLYDAAIRQLSIATDILCGKGKELDKVNNAVLRVQDIITELMASLDFDKGGDIAKNLFSLYMFFNQQLMNANMSKDPEPLKQVLKMMTELRASWATIVEKRPGDSGVIDSSGDSRGVNIAG